jgi:signal peptidase I
MSGVDEPPDEEATGKRDPWAPPAAAQPDSTHRPAADPGAVRTNPPSVATAPQDRPASDDLSGGYGWPIPPRDVPGNGGEPYFHAPPAGAPPPPRRERRSRNPVDRLTRGLPDGLRVTIDWVVTIAGAIAIVLLVKAFVVNPYRIPSSSMEPTLHCSQPAPGCEVDSLGPIDLSDRVLANRFLYRLRDPRRGEIVVFETPPAAQVKCGAGGTFVKRLIGLPGDTVEVRLRQGDGYVYINGKPLNEPYIEKSRRGAVGAFGPVKVKPGHYFMMGDNRAQSCDSRMWGTVPRANLIGKVFATYWPPRRISLH